MSYKFDEASYKDNNKNIIKSTIKLECLIKEKNENPVLFEQKYGQKLFCPECHVPQLCLVRSSDNTTFYLRGFPNQEHLNNCSYSFKTINKHTFSELLKDTNSCKFVNTKLRGLIDSIFKQIILKQNPCLVKMNHNKISKDNIEEQDFNNQQTLRRFPTKSLTAPLEEGDFNNPKFFYGNVDILFSKRKNKTSNLDFFILLVYKKNTNHKICSFSMSEAVFSQLAIPKQIKKTDIVHKNVAIAVATTLTKRDKYINGSIIHSDYCVIETV